MRVLSCVFALVCVVNLAQGAVLLEDDFSDGTLDSTKWSVAGGSVTIENGAAKFTSRGHLNTVQQFDLTSDAALSSGIVITGQWMFSSADDMFQFLTRSDGISTGQYFETQTGLESYYYRAGNGFNNYYRTLSGTSNVTRNITSAGTMNQNEYYNFTLADSGGSTGNVYLNFTSQDGTKSWEYAYRYTGLSATDKNYLTLHNRESGRVSYLDSIKVETLANSVSDDFSSGTIDRTRWTTVSPKGGSATVVDGSLKLLQREYLATLQNYIPNAQGADAPLTITCDWASNNTGDMIQILTRSDALSGNGYGETKSGILFYVTTDGTVSIQTVTDAAATALVTAETKLTKVVDQTYAITITDNGSDLTFDIYQKSSPANRVTVTTTSDFRMDATDGQFVVLHNRESAGFTATIDNLNVYYDTSEFENVGSLQFVDGTLSATAYRQNEDGAIINTVASGTDGVSPMNSGWAIYKSYSPDPATAEFVTGNNGMLNGKIRFNNDLGFESGTIEKSMWTIASPGRNDGQQIRPYGYGTTNQPHGGAFLASPGGVSADTGQVNVGILRSMAFQLTSDGGAIGFSLMGGMGGTDSLVGTTSAALIAAGCTETGFNGVGLRIVSSDEYALSAHRTTNAGSWETLSFSQEQLNTLFDTDPNAWYTLDLIDATDGGWGWVVVDDVTLPYLSDEFQYDTNGWYFLYADGSLVSTFAPVPEPASAWLLALGGIALFLRHRRR